MSAELVVPSGQYMDSYRSLVAEFTERGEPLVPFPLKFPADDFPAMLERLRQCALGSEIASGFVAHETFWLVADGGQVVAVSNLRLSLTPALRVNGGNIGYGVRPSARRQGYATTILRETLARAKARGLERVLVTAHRPNLGSVRAILNNGGILDSEELLPGQPEVLQRYWITT